MKANILFRAIGLAAFVAAAPAFAQTATPAPAKPAGSAYIPPAMSSPPVAPTRTGEPTEQQLALGRDILINSGVAMSIQASVPQLQDKMYNSLIATRPDLVKDLNTTMAALEPEFNGYVEQVLNVASRMYVSQISDADLTAIASFLKSDAGKAYVHAQPTIMLNLSAAIEGWTRKVSVDMLKRVREEMKKKGHEF